MSFLLASTLSFADEARPIDVTVSLLKKQILNKRVFGVHGELLWSPIRYGDTALSKAYNDVGFQDMRLPGGVTNFYLWKSADFGCNRQGPIGKESKDRIRRYNAALRKKNRSYTENDFLSFIKQTSTSFTLVLNEICDTPDNTRTLLEYYKDFGVDVKYVESGSEYYYEEYSWAFPTASDYLRDAALHAKEVKRVFPGAKIGIDVSSSSYRSDDFPDFPNMKKNPRFSRGISFDNAAASASFADALVMHIYTPLGTTRTDKLLNNFDRDKAYKYAIAYFDDRLLPALSYAHNLAPEKKIWITEWGLAFYGWLRKHETNFVNAYYNALYVTNAMLTFFSVPYIESANYHNLPNLWSDFHTLTTNPTYHAIKLFHDPVINSKYFGSVKVHGAQTYNTEISRKLTDHEDINAIFLFNDTDGYLIMLNKMDRHYQIRRLELDTPLDISTSDFLQITPGTHQSTDPETVTIVERSIKAEAVIDIPPFSITRIRIKIGPIDSRN